LPSIYYTDSDDEMGDESSDSIHFADSDDDQRSDYSMGKGQADKGLRTSFFQIHLG
jgi:hypothetical protein